MEPLGHTRWVIPEGWIPGWSHGPAPELVSHEAACVLNTGDDDAQLAITLFFSDREPSGPFEVTVPARRTVHLRFSELAGGDAVAPSTSYSSVIESDVPVVVQHTRLDTRSSRSALMTTIAHPT